MLRWRMINVRKQDTKREALSAADFIDDAGRSHRVFRRVVYDTSTSAPGTGDPNQVLHAPDEAPPFRIITEHYGLNPDCELTSEEQLMAALNPVTA